MTLTESKHPEYNAPRIADWALCEAAYKGEAFVKAAGETYLPKPSGYSAEGGHADGGNAAYAAYKMRAEFPEFLSNAIGAMIGVIHQREIMVQLPPALEYLNENADGDDTPLEDFHRKITRHLLVSGRYGLLADAPMGGGDPYLAGYSGASVINWDRQFFVLDESGYVRNGFAWDYEHAYRVLELVDGQYVQTFYRGAASEDMTPTGLGGGVLNRVPFVIANAREICADIETPPLVGVARAARDIYQLSADQRLQLFQSGQETLVAINGPAPAAVGSGVVHEMQGAEGTTPDLKYVSPSCSGITAHGEKIKERKEAAAQAGARMFEQSQQAQESGDARKLRFQSETANLMTVAQSSCGLLERGLRNIAMMLGQNEDDVIVTPPSDLLDPTIDAQEAATLFGLFMDGGISWETYHERVKKGGLMSSERTADEEYAQIQARPESGADSL